MPRGTRLDAPGVLHHVSENASSRQPSSTITKTSKTYRIKTSSGVWRFDGRNCQMVRHINLRG